MDSSFDRTPRALVPLGLDGVCLYRDSILADFTLGPFRNRLSLDDFVFPADVSRLLVRRQADRTRYRAGLCRHLEILYSLGCSWPCDCSDHQVDAVFCDDVWGRGRLREDGFCFFGISGAVYRRSDCAPPGACTPHWDGWPAARSSART